MIPVTKTHLPPLEKYISQLERIWQDGWVTNNGVLTKELADSLKQFLNIPNIELVANGTLALQIAIKALDLKGEVITTPFSYVATTTALIWEQCNPVFVDIEDKSFCIDAEKIEAAITEHTTAILATHVYGYPCDVKKIEMIAKKYKLKVIYDAAHAFGVKVNQKSLIDYGDCSTLSFHATKLFHTAEGGAIVSTDQKISKKISYMKKFGHDGEDIYIGIGINAKLSDLHAAMGLCMLPNIKSEIENRKNITMKYRSELNSCSLQFPVVKNNIEYNYCYFPVIFPSHESMMRVRRALQRNHIYPRRYFYPSLNTLPYLQDCEYNSCPVSESIAQRVLALPLYHSLSESDIVKISKIIMNNIV